MYYAFTQSAGRGARVSRGRCLPSPEAALRHRVVCWCVWRHRSGLWHYSSHTWVLCLCLCCYHFAGAVLPTTSLDRRARGPGMARSPVAFLCVVLVATVSIVSLPSAFVLRGVAFDPWCCCIVIMPPPSPLPLTHCTCALGGFVPSILTREKIKIQEARGGAISNVIFYTHAR